MRIAAALPAAMMMAFSNYEGWVKLGISSDLVSKKFWV
jgi:hypothetical protein